MTSEPATAADLLNDGSQPEDVAASDPVHIPILTETILELLDIGPAARCIDATINGGGHTSAILERSAPAGVVLGIDRDPGVLGKVGERLAGAVTDGRLVLARGNFGDLASIAAEHGFSDVDAILFDVGVSSYHFDHSGRGFRFAADEPLDMRFDAEDASLYTAAELLQALSLDQLTEIFRDLGEERFARRVAYGVVKAREEAPVETTAALLEIITRSLPGNVRWRAARSAARVFQGLRIAVNDELGAIRAALPQAFALLRPGGRMAVLAFHSLEDRIVKRFFVDRRQAGEARILTKRPLQADAEEIAANPRAASAKLRVLEKKSDEAESSDLSDDSDPADDSTAE